MINSEKLAISLSHNTMIYVMDIIKIIFGVSVVHGDEVYLGLPTSSLTRKVEQFTFLQDIVCNKLKG